MEYLCPHCQKTVDCGTSSGQIGCPYCQAKFTVPSLPVATARPPAPPRAVTDKEDLPKTADAQPNQRTLRKRPNTTVRPSGQQFQKSYPALRILSTIFLYIAWLDLVVLAVCWAFWVFAGLWITTAPDAPIAGFLFGGFSTLLSLLATTVFGLTYALIFWTFSQLLMLAVNIANDIRMSRDILADMNVDIQK